MAIFPFGQCPFMELGHTAYRSTAPVPYSTASQRKPPRFNAAIWRSVSRPWRRHPASWAARWLRKVRTGRRPWPIFTLSCRQFGEFGPWIGAAELSHFGRIP